MLHAEQTYITAEQTYISAEQSYTTAEQTYITCYTNIIEVDKPGLLLATNTIIF